MTIKEINEWYTQFKDGRTSINNNSLYSTFYDKSTSKCGAHVTSHYRLTVRLLESELIIPQTITSNILSEQLDYSTTTKTHSKVGTVCRCKNNSRKFYRGT